MDEADTPYRRTCRMKWAALRKLIFVYRNVYFLECGQGAGIGKCGIIGCILSTSQEIFPGFRLAPKKTKYLFSALNKVPK
jgi:hypothetical protein